MQALAFATPARSPRRRRGAAGGGAGLPGHRAARSDAAAARRILERPRPRLQPQDGRARLARHDVAQAVWRPRAQRAGALRGAGGDARGRCARRLSLGGGPAERAQHPEERDGGAEAADPAEDRGRRVLVLHRHERTRFRVRPGGRAHPGAAGAGRLAGQRHQGVDVVRPRRRLHDPVLPHRRQIRGRPPRRRQPVPGGHEAGACRRHDGAPDHRHARRPPLQRGRDRGPAAAAGRAARPAGGRLEAGHRRTRLRAKSGPDRFLSAFTLLVEAVRALGPRSARAGGGRDRDG